MNTKIASLSVGMLGLLAACGGEPGEAPGNEVPQIAQVESELVAVSDEALVARALMITDPSVVDAPAAQSRLDNASATGTGAWSFAHIVKSLAGSQDPQLFAESFLQQLTVAQTVNGFVTEPVPDFNANGTVDMREALGRWCRTSKGRLDLSKAPFRLQAIVNRLDLRESSSSAGELRFIFNLLETDDACKNSSADAALLPKVVGTSGLTVIFEFSQRAGSCSSTHSLAGKWRTVAALPFGAEYNTKLASLTQRTVGYHDPARPNRSQINQVRTNEPSSASLWTFRELRLGGLAPTLTSTNALVMVPPAGVLDASVNNSPELKVFANVNRVANRSGNLTTAPIPLTFLGKPFAGAASRSFERMFVDGFEDRDLSFQTCAGCHFAQGTFGAHVGVKTGRSLLGRELGEGAALSPFLTGMMPGQGELQRRVALLRALVDSSSCSTVEATGAVASFRPNTVGPGEALYVSSISSAEPGTSVRLYRASDPDTAAPLKTTSVLSTAALTTTVIVAPSVVGSYDVRLFRGPGRIARSQPVSVE